MKKLFPFLFLFTISVIFFYKTFVFFQVPFPGDLLISTYSPWKYESFLGYNPGSYPDKAQYFDVIRQLYPWKVLAIDMWKNGEIPLWNPYNFSGTPLLANNQSSVFYPGNLLFFVTNYSAAWSLYIYIQPLMASIFMYLYIRSLKLSKAAALIAAVSYSYSLFMATFLEYGNFGHSILWLPLLLFLIEKFKSKPRKYFPPMISIIIAIVIFAGHLQIASGVIFAVLIYAVVRLYKTKFKALMFLASFTLGIGIGAIQLLPTLELLSLSARVSHPSDIINNLFLLKPEQLVLFFVPDFYGNPATRNYLLTDTYPGNAVYIGIIPILFFISAIFKKQKENMLKLFIIASIGLFILFIKNPVSIFIFNSQLFSASSPSNYFFLFAFCMSVVSAFGVDAKSTIKKNLLIVGCASFFILLFVFIHYFLRLQFNTNQLLLSFVIFVISVLGYLAFRLFKTKFIFSIPILILIFELFYFFTKFNPFVPTELIYPKTEISSYLIENIGINRFTGHKAANFEPNFSTQFRIFSPDGYDPLYSKSYNDYTNATSRSDARIQLEQSRILDSLSVKYILDRVENGSDQKVFPPTNFSPRYSDSGWIVYENNNALPRAYIIDKEEIKPAIITEYTPNKVKIENTKKSKGQLVLTDTDYPGWVVSIDGQEKRIEKYDEILRSVQVNENDRSIIFEYRPKSFYMGLIITIISVAGVGAMLLLQKLIWRKY